MDRSSLYSLNGSRLELAPKPSMGQAERNKPLPSDDSLGFIIPLLLTLLELASLGVISWHHWGEAKKPPVEEAPEVVENTSLCRDGAASYEYRMVFRLGNPTATFNTARAFLDFELLGLDGERQGEVCRVDLSKLPNSVYGEVNCLIQRLNPLPPLLGLRAHHSDPSGTIFLYDYQLENGQTGATMEIRQFNVHLTNLPTVYKGKVLREEALEEGYYPEVPTPPWAPLEVALLAFFTVANTCLAVSCLEFFNHSYHPSVRSQVDHRQGNLVRSFHDIAIALPLMGTIMCGIILSFKYTLKKALHKDKYAIVPAEASDNARNCALAVFATLLLFSLFGAIGSITLGAFFTFTKSVFVWSSSLIVCVCIFGCWASGSEAAFISQVLDTPSSQVHAPPDKLHGRSQLASPYYTPSRPGSHTNGEERTVLFAPPAKKGEKVDDEVYFQGTVLFGPKMFGPKLGPKQSTGPGRKASALGRCPKGSAASLKTIAKRVASQRRLSPGGIPAGVPLRRNQHHQGQPLVRHKMTPILGKPTLRKLTGRQETLRASLKRQRISPGQLKRTASPRPVSLGRKASKRSLKK